MKQVDIKYGETCEKNGIIKQENRSSTKRNLCQKLVLLEA